MRAEKQLLDLLNKDKVDKAQVVFEHLISKKVAQILEARKEQIASKIFNKKLDK